MTLCVPKPAADYLAAERSKDAERLSLCFIVNGLVHDEGRDAIRHWKQAVDDKYHYTMQPLSAQTHGDQVTVRARLTGDFPGSPVELDYFFKLSNDKIASLESR